MRIEENKIFLFVFPEFEVEVTADTQLEAAHQLQEWLNDAMVELSMSFPKTAPIVTDIFTGETTVPITEFNKLQITHLDEMIVELAKYRRVDGTREENIKNLTELDAKPENFKEIVNRLTILINTYKDNVRRVDDSDSHGEIIKKK